MYVVCFSDYVKLNGPPKLNTEQFKRFMNIVYLEGQNKNIDHLTNKLPPELLLLEMIGKTRNGT